MHPSRFSILRFERYRIQNQGLHDAMFCALRQYRRRFRWKTQNHYPIPLFHIQPSDGFSRRPAGEEAARNKCLLLYGRNSTSVVRGRAVGTGRLVFNIRLRRHQQQSVLSVSPALLVGPTSQTYHQMDLDILHLTFEN